MILINLLPHREEARKRRKEAFFVSLGIAALIGGVICGFIYAAYQAQISSQNEKNAFLQKEITKLENEIKEVSTLQAEIASLRARQQAVESLQADRNMPVYLLTELVKQLPDGVYVSSMKQDNVTLSLLGTAQSQERVSELLRNLANNSQWFNKPELIEIVAGSVALTPRDQRRVSNFSIKVQVRKPTDVQKPAAGASGAAGLPVAQEQKKA
ncbi:PilN domain-containing protein [Variovorax sp. PCZ-1]|uniref:PilN domain-containing protein n=1 Tax=Variovorax sp. PCZ-1 TaxID=2835533 RepID=UPI001BCC9EB2|nr:PilN domain-containing protein [Variovorax sp. PCZ-1]